MILDHSFLPGIRFLSASAQKTEAGKEASAKNEANRAAGPQPSLSLRVRLFFPAKEPGPKLI